MTFTFCQSSIKCTFSLNVPQICRSACNDKITFFYPSRFSVPSESQSDLFYSAGSFLPSSRQSGPTNCQKKSLVGQTKREGRKESPFPYLVVFFLFPYLYDREQKCISERACFFESGINIFLMQSFFWQHCPNCG